MNKKSQFQRSSIFLFGIFSIFFLLYSAFEGLATPELPQENNPIILYSNDLSSDLRLTFVSAIQKAQKSIVLMVYSLTDPAILQVLNQKAEAGIPVYLVLDKEASSSVFSSLSRKIQLVKRRGPGLMHYKVLVIDEASLFLGSANMTTRSLRTHGNLVLGFYDPKLALYFVRKAYQMNERLETPKQEASSFVIGDQLVEISLLPDDRLAVEKLIHLIKTAKKTIRVAMYTWTRRDFAEALKDASKRGVDVQIVLDRSAARGSSKIAYHRLQQLHLPVALSEGEPLLHYKMMIIDDEWLVNGSANWTQAAFNKNDDYFMVLHGLNPAQREQLKELWGVIEFESFTEEAG